MNYKILNVVLIFITCNYMQVSAVNVEERENQIVLISTPKQIQTNGLYRVKGLFTYDTVKQSYYPICDVQINTDCFGNKKTTYFVKDYSGVTKYSPTQHGHLKRAHLVYNRIHMYLGPQKVLEDVVDVTYIKQHHLVSVHKSKSNQILSFDMHNIPETYQTTCLPNPHSIALILSGVLAGYVLCAMSLGI